MRKLIRKTDLYTIKEAASYLGVTESRMRSAIRRRELPVVKLRRLVRFHIIDLKQWVEKSKIPASRGGRND